MEEVKGSESIRTKLILSYANAFAFCFSLLYSLLLGWGYVEKYVDNSGVQLFPVYSIIVIPALFYLSYFLNNKNKYGFSRFVLVFTLLIINFSAGIWWGFDLPSLILSYIFCIVILALTSKTKENIYYNAIIIISILLGNYLRIIFKIQTNWHNNASFGLNDIIEFSIMFIFITFILIKFNQEQNKTLTRALRVENVLKKERDNLSVLVQKKTAEIKQMQIEEISKMYHLVEFGKLSSGLFHDLVTPIQTLSLYIEKLSSENLILDSKISNTVANIKNTHEKLFLMMQNIRKQMSFTIEDEKFNLVTEVGDIINLVRNNYLKNYVNINFSYQSNAQILDAKKAVLNHIVLDLISNAYEACLQDKNINNKDNYTIDISIGKHENKNFISVTDNGIGIKAENLPKIFDDFYSSKKNIAEKENCGLGLSSSKYYTQKYLQGKIFVESEPDIGTTMSLVF